MKANKCPCCGSSNINVDWSGTTEYSFGGFQSFDIMCFEDDCQTSLSIEINTDRMKSSNVEEIGIDAWNKINILK